MDRETRAALAASIDAAHAAGESFFLRFETESKGQKRMEKTTHVLLSLFFFFFPNQKQKKTLTAAVKGDTRPPREDEAVDLHFVAFVESGGRLWELDGRKVAPVDRGETSTETLLKDAAAVIGREFVRSETAEGSLSFNLLALVGGKADE